MSLPTLDKTWQFSVNTQILPTGSGETNRKNVLLEIKSKLMGFTTLPWTVIGSSDGSTGALDATDRWVDNGDLVIATAGVAHSWIVLQDQNGMQVCFDLSDTASAFRDMVIVVSPGGNFSGGSVTNRPTATDEDIMVNGTAWLDGGAGADYGYKVHAMMSDDGKVTRIFVGNRSLPCTYMFFEEAKNPLSAWTDPVVYGHSQVSAGSEVNTYALLNDAIIGKFRHSSTNCDFFFAGFGYKGTLVGEKNISEDTGGRSVNDASLRWDFNGVIRIWCETASHEGLWGELYDCYFVPSEIGTHATFTDTLASNSRSFIKVGTLVLPWDGTSTPEFW